MASYYKVGRTWTVAYYHHGHRKYARGLPSKELAKQVAATKEFGKHAAEHGIIDPRQLKFTEEAQRSLSAHLDDLETHMRAKKNTPKHIAATRAIIERVFEAAGVRRIDHMERLKLVKAIDELPQERGEAALSIARKNRALAACKTFGYFLEKHDRILRNPLARESTRNEELDRRRVRRALTEDEAVKLIETTATQKMRGGMTGEDRMIRYALGIGTGLRQRTLFGLTPEDFHLYDDPPFIRVYATNTKGKKEYDQPIREDLAEMLRPWLATKKPGKPVFPKLPAAKPIIAYRRDLEAAGIKYNVEGSIEFCDQHAQRNHYITAVIRAAGLKVAQDLARHSTPLLTSKYGRMEVRDYAKGLEGLPRLKRPAATDRKKKTG